MTISTASPSSSSVTNPAISQDDEIDLFELVENLWQEKILIVAITALVTLVAVVYALTATPVYQATSILKLAQIKDLDELNELKDLEVYSLTPDESLVRAAIKPNKKLIVAIGVILGGMLGVLVALVRSAVRKRQAALQTRV